MAQSWKCRTKAHLKDDKARKKENGDNTVRFYTNMVRVHFRCTTWCNTKTTKIGCSYGVKKRRHRVSFSTRVNACDRLDFFDHVRQGQSHPDPILYFCDAGKAFGVNMPYEQ